MKIDEILNTDVQNFIHQNLNSDLSTILLKKNPFPNLNFGLIADQIKGKKTAEKKWPFLTAENIVFPVHLSLEQASSELTAQFKSQFHQGKNFVDLTCGFGIDAYFLSENFENRHLVEQNNELINIVSHNWGVLGRKAQFHNSKLEDFLEHNTKKFDLIYLDPARRDENNRKKVFLEDLSPNLIEIEEKLLTFSENVLVKLSPMMDISALQNQLKFIGRIDVISVKNEVKELLIHLNKDKKSLNSPIFCHNLGSNDPSTCIDANTEETIIFSEPLRTIQIPNASIMKVGKFGKLCKDFNLKKLHPNTHILTSESWVENFPGRQFEIEILSKNDLKSKSQYNLIIRNYPLTDNEIKKKYQIKDGGKDYLIFTQSTTKKYILRSK